MCKQQIIMDALKRAFLRAEKDSAQALYYDLYSLYWGYSRRCKTPKTLRRLV